MKIKKIVFLDADPDLAGYRLSPDIDGILYVALKPEVYSALKRKGLQVQDTTSYFTNDSHAKVLDRSKILSEWLRKNAPFRGVGSGVRTAYKDLFVFWARLSYTNFMWIIEIVHNAVAAFGPEVIAAPFSGASYAESLSPETEERFLGHIVRAMAGRCGIGFEDIPSTRSRSAIGSVVERRIIPNFKYLVKMIGFQFWLLAVFCESRVSGKGAIFFTSKKYQMDKLAEEAQGSADPRYKVYFLKGPIMINGRMNRLLSAFLMCSKLVGRFDVMCDRLIGKMSLEKEIFSCSGISFSDLLARKIKSNICGNVESLYVWAARADECLDLLKPAAVLSNGNRSDDVAIAELCRKKGIPSVLISHGSHVHPKNDYEKIEWGEHGRALLRAPFDTLALQSPLAEAYLNVFPTGSRKLFTGPVLWGKTVDRRNREKIFETIIGDRFNIRKTRVIVHAGTPKSSKRFRLWVYETPDEYLAAVSDLARAVDSIPDTVLIVRFRPLDEISVREIRARIGSSDKVILSAEGSLDEALVLADLLVSFSSTAIEEALQNRIPVMLYGGNGRYQHIIATEIKAGDRVAPNAVYHVNRASDLSYALSGILDLGLVAGGHKELFDRYIYPENSRTSIGDFLDTVFTKK